MPFIFCLLLTFVCFSASAYAQFETPSDPFAIQPSVTLQFRQDNKWSPGDSLQTGFALRRARAQVNGAFLSPELNYEIDVEFKTPDANAVPISLKDFYLSYGFKPWANLIVGQYKVPFSYQFEVSGSRQQFNERSLSDDVFSTGRDIGVMLYGASPVEGLGYHLGLFNGEGENRLNPDYNLASFAELHYAPWGEYPTEESDWEGVETPRMLLKTALWKSVEEESDVFKASAFAGFKWQGLSLQGHLFSQYGKNTLGGGYFQAGYFLLRKQLETALRSSHVLYTDHVEYEYAMALNYYISGHALKLQSDYTLKYITDPSLAILHRVVVQLQMAF